MKSSRSIANYFRLRSGVLAATIATALCGLFSPEVAENQIAVPQPPPYWAYVVNPPEPASASTKPADNTPVHVPDGTATFTVAQTQNFFAPPDWHPADHPAMPKIVSAGRPKEVLACGYCHLPNGQGRPENPSLAGLPAAYIVQQMADFKAGRRKASEPRQGPVNYMVSLASKTNDDDVRAAAGYFSSLKPKAWIRVVDTKTVPKTRAAGWMLVPAPGREPIGERIIESAENLGQTELRNDDSGFVAYVPAGSIAEGKVLVTTGGGKTIPCNLCHGSDLRGKNDAPSIAGRSPSYIVRQLYDIRSGTRNGMNTPLMKPTVAKLTLGDIVSIAAYTSSLHP